MARMQVHYYEQVKSRFVTCFLLIFLSIFSRILLSQTIPVFTIVLVEKPLTIYALPIQQAQANSPFYFNVSPFISRMAAEVDYQVTSNFKRPLTGIDLMDVPPGVTRAYDGDGVCSPSFTLNPNQSCLLRLIIDKNKYTHSKQGGPIVCFHPPTGYCAKPAPGAGAQIDEAAQQAQTTQVTVTPMVQDGLRFDATTLSIIGQPTRTGVYLFSISASNGYATAQPRDLQINVSINPHDKPVFKTNYPIASALPGQAYRLNLADLIEVTPGLMLTNQLYFRIDTNHAAPAWLNIDSQNGYILQGHVPASEAGLPQQVTLIASSNTGGDSLPQTITIPIAFDPAKKPIIKQGIELTGIAGEWLLANFQTDISDPSHDNNLTLVIDAIEPQAPWLTVSVANPTELTGLVPREAVGQHYQITLHANTRAGGNSESQTIPLTIAIDNMKTPRFYATKPVLPVLHVDQPYFYDFVANRDIYPEYQDIPYRVELASGYDNPDWVRIDDNQLIIDKAPHKLNDTQQIAVTISNVPGGRSTVVLLEVMVMH